MPIPETGYIYLIMTITFPLWSVIALVKGNYDRAVNYALSFTLALIAFLNSMTMITMGFGE